MALNGFMQVKAEGRGEKAGPHVPLNGMILPRVQNKPAGHRSTSPSSHTSRAVMDAFSANHFSVRTYRAGDGARTHDSHVGNVALYH